MECTVLLHVNGARGGAVVEVLGYKLEGRRIDSQWNPIGIFH
jgi:hypothetical protein